MCALVPWLGPRRRARVVFWLGLPQWSDTPCGVQGPPKVEGPTTTGTQQDVQHQPAECATAALGRRRHPPPAREVLSKGEGPGPGIWVFWWLRHGTQNGRSSRTSTDPADACWCRSVICHCCGGTGLRGSWSNRVVTATSRLPSALPTARARGCKRPDYKRCTKAVSLQGNVLWPIRATAPRHTPTARVHFNQVRTGRLCLKDTDS